MGLAALTTYSPERTIDSDELSRLTGIPAEIYREKFGFTRKHVSAEDEHVSDMALAAADRLLQETGTPRGDVGVVVYCGSSFKDYGMWSCAAFLVHALRTDRAYGFEIMAHCAGFLVALWNAESLLRSDDSIDSVLVVGASKDSAVVDYGDPDAKSLFNFGDGAAAALVTRDGGARILAHASVTEGEFHDSVTIPAGGSVVPVTQDALDRGLHRARVKPGLSLRDAVTPLFVAAVAQAARTALARAGIGPADVDHVVVQNQIPSVHRRILEGVGVPESRCAYFQGHGHMSSLDPVFALRELAERGDLERGDRVLLLAAGLGYTATALVIEWDPSVSVTTVR